MPRSELCGNQQVSSPHFGDVGFLGLVLGVGMVYTIGSKLSEVFGFEPEWSCLFMSISGVLSLEKP